MPVTEISAEQQAICKGSHNFIYAGTPYNDVCTTEGFQKVDVYECPNCDCWKLERYNSQRNEPDKQYKDGYLG